MKAIALFTQNLSTGGVQKSVSSLANYLSSIYKVNIILAEDDKSIEYELENGINIYKIKTKIIDIEKDGVGEEIFKYRVEALDAILEKLNVDLALSYEDYNNLILLQTKARCKKLVSCRVSLSQSYKTKNPIHLLDSSFYFEMIRELYPKADAVIAVANHIKDELLALNPSMKTCTIYNGIKELEVIKDSISDEDFILNIGRLHPQKGQKDLIYAFNSIKDEIEQNLIILGDGVLKKELESLILELDLGERVFLKGFSDPYPYIQKCDLFVFPSYYEGFSNSILEVMSMAKAIVSYNYAGANEILPLDSLVECSDIEGLSKKMLTYIKNKDANKLLADKLYLTSKNFSLEKNLKTFEDKIAQEMERICVE